MSSGEQWQKHKKINGASRSIFLVLLVGKRKEQKLPRMPRLFSFSFYLSFFFLQPDHD
jgi:hypothetical protein